MSRGTILVVDDSPLTIEAMRRGLEADGFSVRSATDLADVPRSLEDAGVDLVLMDVEMAEAFGDDLAMMLRSDHVGPPIYLLSALEEGELAERAAASGADGFIQKRAGVGEVVQRIGSILGAPEHEPGADLRAGLLPLFFETARRRARHARASLRIGGRGEVRQAAYELHALVGEAAVLGFTELAELAQEGRRAATRCLDGPTTEARRACEDLLSSLEEQVEEIAAFAVGSARAVRGSVPPTSARRVLLLDDSDIYRATLRAILEDSGYQVIEATTIAECRALLATAAADLVVLDVELDDGCGLDLIPEVRAVLPASPVVVLSGGEQLTVTDLADLVLLKTLDPTTVLVKLERLLADRSG